LARETEVPGENLFQCLPLINIEKIWIYIMKRLRKGILLKMSPILKHEINYSNTGTVRTFEAGETNR
jgi:hypothetical protein